MQPYSVAATKAHRAWNSSLQALLNQDFRTWNILWSWRWFLKVKDHFGGGFFIVVGGFFFLLLFVLVGFWWFFFCFYAPSNSCTFFVKIYRYKRIIINSSLNSSFGIPKQRGLQNAKKNCTKCFKQTNCSSPWINITTERKLNLRYVYVI